MRYELCYLVGESNESNLEAIKNEVKEMIVQNKAVLVQPEFLEKRKMAYRVKKDIRGTYVAVRFDLPDIDAEENYNQNSISAISKKMNLNQNILRFLIVKADDLPEIKIKEEKNIEKSKESVKTKKVAVEKTAEKVEEKKEIKTEDIPLEKSLEERSDIDKKLDEILNI